MAIITFDENEVIDYIPESERESDEPCIVRMKYVSYAQAKRYSNIIAARTKESSSISKMNRVSQEVQKQQFLDNVVEIVGFYCGKRLVTDAAEFFDRAPTSLILEIVRAMEDIGKLTEGQRKNSRGVSGGSSESQRTGAPTTVPTAPQETKKLGIVPTGEDSARELGG